MNNVYDNGTIMLGKVEDIKKQIEYLVNNNQIDLDYFTEINEDLKDFENDTIIAINYDNGMGYSYDYWTKEDIVKVGK